MDLPAAGDRGNGRGWVGGARERGAATWLAAAFAAAAAVVLYAVLGPAAEEPLVAVVFAGLALAGLALVVVVLALRPMLGRGLGGGRARLLAAAVDEGPEAVSITDPKGEEVYANAAYRALVGAGPDGPALDRLRATARAEGRASGEITVTDGDGRPRVVRLTARALPGGGSWTAWHAADVTERRAWERELAEHRERLSAFIEDAPVGCYEIDGDGRFTFVNRTLAGWLGRDREAMLDEGVRLADVIDGGDGAPAPATDPLDGAALGRLTLRGRGGNVFAVEVAQMVVRDADGRPRGARATVRDLTQEQTLQAALHQAEERFRRFFDFAPVGVVTLDREGRVAETNAAFRAMTKESGDAAVGRPVVDLVSKEDRAELGALLDATLGGGTGAGPLEVRLRGSSQRVAELYASRISAPDGAVTGAVLHLIDTTEQKNLEIQFAQSQKMQAVGQLAGGIAHDFNNLLTAMIGFCDLLLLRHQAGDESFSDIMQIKQNASRAASLVRQLLAFSRQLTLRPKVLDITDVLAELSHLLRRLIGETIELKVVHGRDLGLVKVDHGQLEQVIINLAVNARDAMPDGGTLTIRTANVTAEESTRLGHELMPPGEYVLIETADTGLGIPAEHLGKIFEPFFTTKEVGAGTGLGLSTVYGIVKQTGGYIFPANLPEGGASFRIYLPRYRGGAETERTDEDAEPQGARDLTGKGVVLLVEDEDAVRTFAARALRNKGYTVLEAESGESALRVVKGHDGAIDLLISDVVMPQMDGPTLVKRVRSSSPETKIIFISGYAEDAFRKNLDQDGRDFMFLPKPFSLKQLAGKVKEVLAGERG